ncbi:MAG: hypothetical protein M1830_010744, partial [Pleopsidium flavum]
ELFITNFDDNPGFLFSAILKHHGSLQTLAIHTPPDQTYKRKAPPVWTTEQLEQLHEHFAKLSHLEIDIGLAEGQWPSHTATILARFSRVRTLKLYVEVPITASGFSDEYKYDVWGSVCPPPLKEDRGNEVLTGLFRQVFKVDPYAFLTHLEVCFTRLDISDRMDSYIVENPIWVRRLERDDAPRPDEGGFRVDCIGSWRVAGRQ